MGETFTQPEIDSILTPDVKNSRFISEKGAFLRQYFTRNHWQKHIENIKNKINE